MKIVLTDRGKNTMDRIRVVTDEMILAERQMFAQRALDWRKAATNAFWVTSGGSLVLLVLIAVAAAIDLARFQGAPARVLAARRPDRPRARR